MPILDRSEPPAAAEVPQGAWHTLDIAAVWPALTTTADGLPEAEAAARLETIGRNRLPHPAGVSALRVLVAQLRSIVVALLVAAMVVSLVIGDWIEAAAIAVVLVINTALGFLTEWRARRAMEALLELQASRAAVMRGGVLQAIDAELLVPGDVVQLDAGNTVPADVRLMEAAEFSTDEAALTGESLPVEKQPEVVFELTTPIADRANLAYMGTTVASGTALAVVVATGSRTELGRIGELVNRVETGPTPLEERLDALGRRLAWLTLAVAALVGAIGLAQGTPPHLVLQVAIALAVAAMPEALPAVATIALAVGMQRMARRHALVRRLPSVETLGSTTVVCTDKTRTLTTGDMAVVRIWAADAEWTAVPAATAPPAGAAKAVLESAALASLEPAATTSGDQRALGNPVDLAVLQLLAGSGASREALLATRPLRALVPFSSSRKWMASLHQTGEVLHAYVKGAPSRVMALCSAFASPAGAVALDDRRRAEVLAVNERYGGDGLRVIAVASGPVSGRTEDAVRGLTFEGLLCLADPVAPGVADTVARLRRAGLRTIMITGDQRATATAVGRQIGLMDEAASVLDGRDLDALGADGLRARIDTIAVFSRVSPEHKLVIVSALQQRDEVVAMLGDGVNDAAALKKADVGVAMGVRGTDVAKQAASIVLQDDRFETVAAAVEEGRVIFDNIRKFVLYLFSCNVAEVLVLLTATVAGLPIPLQPLQLLWLNMVTDTFPALALAMEPGDATVMQRPPRNPNEAILSRPFVTAIFVYAAAITASTLAAFGWALVTDPERAPTLAFMTLGIAQIAHLGNARSEAAVLSPARALANRYALAGAAVALLLQLATTIEPLASLLQVAPMTPAQWLVVLGCAAVPAVGGQVFKTVRGPAGV